MLCISGFVGDVLFLIVVPMMQAMQVWYISSKCPLESSTDLILQSILITRTNSPGEPLDRGWSLMTTTALLQLKLETIE